MSESSSKAGRNAIASVLVFTFRHWTGQIGLLAAIGGGVAVATLSEIIIPLYAGRMVDAVTTVSAVA